MKHTPGPWQQHDGDFVCVDGDASKMICDIRGWGWLSKTGESNAIAIQTANAKLIAAAPDLLEALITAKDAIDDLMDIADGYDKDLEKVRAAIKKATE